MWSILVFRSFWWFQATLLLSLVASTRFGIPDMPRLAAWISCWFSLFSTVKISYLDPHSNHCIRVRTSTHHMGVFLLWSPYHSSSLPCGVVVLREKCERWTCVQWVLTVLRLFLYFINSFFFWVIHTGICLHKQAYEWITQFGTIC